MPRSAARSARAGSRYRGTSDRPPSQPRTTSKGSKQAHQPFEQRRIVLEDAAVHGEGLRSANEVWRSATNAANSRRKRSAENRAAFARQASSVIRCALASNVAYGGGDGFRCLLVEQYTGGRRGIESADRFQRAAAAVGDHRRTARLCFQRRNAEILLRGEHERARGRKPMVALDVRQLAQQSDVGSGGSLDARPLGAVADHDEFAVGQEPECVHDQVDALVRNEARYGDVARATHGPRAGCAPERQADRSPWTRGHSNADAVRDGIRNRDEVTDPAAGGAVPIAQAIERATDEPAAGASIEADLAQVLVLQVPCIAHRRVAVADVQLRRRSPDTFGDRMRTGDHEVVARTGRSARWPAGTTGGSVERTVRAKGRFWMNDVLIWRDPSRSWSAGAMKSTSVNRSAFGNSASNSARASSAPPQVSSQSWTMAIFKFGRPIVARKFWSARSRQWTQERCAPFYLCHDAQMHSATIEKPTSRPLQPSFGPNPWRFVSPSMPRPCSHP